MASDDKKKSKRRKSAEEAVKPDLSNQFAEPSGYDFSNLFQDPAEMLSRMFGIQQTQLDGGQQHGNEQERLRMMQELGEEDLRRKQYEAETVRGAQVRPEELFQAQAKAQNPVEFAQQRKEAQLADPFGPGGYFAGRTAAENYTPEEILASQGNTARNQIMRNRQPLNEEQRAKGEFDPEELMRQNRIYSANRTYV